MNGIPAFNNGVGASTRRQFIGYHPDALRAGANDMLFVGLAELTPSGSPNRTRQKRH